VALSLGAAGLNRLHLLAVKMSSIEKLNDVATIVFDKTGTLTAGEPIVKFVEVEGTTSIDRCIEIAANMENGSHHPFAKAITSYALNTKWQKKGGVAKINNKSHYAEIGQLKQVSGQGIEATFEGLPWRLGNEKFIRVFLEENHSKSHFVSTALLKKIKNWRKQGYSVLYLANIKGVQAIFCIVDPLREGIKSFLSQADQLGIKRQIILSGDHQKSVDAIATQLGIKEAHGGMSPQEKLAWVRALQQDSKKKIMMLGDGVNDAPTLAVADISLTFSEATDLAKNNSDFILLSKDYKELGKAFFLMKKTRRIVLQNLAWAIAYNLVAIPLAVMGVITPWMAAIGMSVSSLVVVLNSLRLR